MLRTPLALVVSVLWGTTALAQTSAQAQSNVVNPRFTPPASEVAPTRNPDPWEGLNRKLYGLFEAVDPVLLRPPAIFYKHAAPRPVRTGLRNAFSNLHEPVIFFNDVLQFHFTDAGTTLGRIAVNSTVGLAGLFDPATNIGLAYHNNGFGTTFGRYGAPPGPYIFIPALGPSDVRDTIGAGLDSLSDPLTWIRFTGRWELSAGRTVISGLDARANADGQLKEINSTATDPYATIRSLYLQNRQAEITGGQVNVNALPSFGDEPAGAPNQATSPGSPDTNPAGPLGDAAALPGRTAPTTNPPAAVGAPEPGEPSPAGSDAATSSTPSPDQPPTANPSQPR